MVQTKETKEPREIIEAEEFIDSFCNALGVDPLDVWKIELKAELGSVVEVKVDFFYRRKMNALFNSKPASDDGK